MFDMHFVQPPTNFLGFFFLGLCWPVSVPPGPPADRGRLWAWPKRLLSGLAICTVLVIGWIDVTHDIEMRRGELAEAAAIAYLDAGARDAGQKYLEAAVAHYKAALSPFSRIIAQYKIGHLSLMLPQQTDQAQAYLDRVAAMDPNFSHLNLLYGQLHLQKKDWAGAESYFRRECQFYPRSERAWQNMYTFAAGSGLYGRLTAIDTLLAEIYRERARQNYTDAGLAARQKTFAEHAPHKNPADALADAEALLDLIHHKFVDPLFVEMIAGQRRPAPFLAAGFNVLDAGMWRLRHTLFAALQTELGPLPVPAADLASWYAAKITIQPGEPLTFPLGVWNRRAGSALSAYLLFSMVCELNHYPAIICTDGRGQPVHAYVFAQQPVRDGMLPIDAAQTAANLQRVDIFQVDLAARSCKPVAAADFKKNFQWRSGRTLVFYPLPDYFLRNQILGVIVKDAVPWLPRRPPSKRLLDLFALTDSQPPPPALLRHFCFEGHIRRHLERIHALQPQPADKNTKFLSPSGGEAR
jgi:tetratricopeptide (TPR) repeat protein